MNPQHPRLPSPAASAVALLALLSVGAARAADEPNPYHFGISQTETADTNVFRLPTAVPRSRDLISTTAVFAGVDQPLGRGRFVANVKADTSRFKNNKDLDHSGGDANVRLDWESIGGLSGDIGAYHRRSLYRSDPSNQNLVTQRDLLRNSGANARVQLGLTSLLAVDGGVSHSQSRHSSTAQNKQDLDQTAGNIGLRVRPSDLWSARIGWRETRAEYPRFVTINGATTANELRRHDLDLSGVWVPTGVSRLDARLSYTQQEQSFAGASDTRLWTGLLGYNWQPTGKSRVRLQYSRDSNVGESDVDLRLLPQETRSDSTVRNAIQLEGKWNPSAKTNVDTSFSHSRRKLVTNVTNVTERDSLNVFSLGAGYQPIHSVQLGCRITHERRGTDGTNNNTYAYKVDTGTCHVQFSM